jgi:hypothetical protein
MKSRAAIILLCVLPFLLSAQSMVGKLVIEKQKTFELHVSKEVIIDTLIMMDSSRIRLNTTHQSDNIIRARIAIIGEHCFIEGRGINGIAGKNGVNGRTSSGPCRNGTAGKSGGRGEDGKRGANLFLYLEKIIVNGNLIIDLAGGNGGDGGNGGEGGGGTPGTVHCDGGDGGIGGDAGPGGNGGAGGTLIFSGTDLETMREMLGSHIIVNILGGNYGYGGIPGTGGSPGLGPSRNDGKGGLSGKNGMKGRPGSNGGIQFEQQ